MPHVAYEANAGMAVLAAWEADVSRCGRVSCCFLFSPGPFFDGFVGDHLFTFLQLLMEEATPAAAVCRIVFPALRVYSQGSHISFAHVLVPQLWATNGKVLHRECPSVFFHLPCGAHGQSSVFCAVWVVCTWWGDRRGPGPQCWAPCLCSWYWGCGGGFILECMLNHWNESCPYASTSWMKC